MAQYTPKLVDQGFQNWVKASLGLSITKDGITDAVGDRIKSFHLNVLNNVLTPEQILNNDICTQCRKQNILPCPTSGMCIVRPGNCSFHDSSQNFFRPCPKHICDGIKDEIKKCHRFNNPSWKNTSTERWCQNPWEIAKCFLPPNGYASVNAIEETDINGIVNLIINLTFIKTGRKLPEQVRQIGRDVRHSPDLCVTDNDLGDYIDILIKFLSTSKLCKDDSKAKTAVQKLKELKNDDLTITTNDVTRVLTDSIQAKTCESVEQINDTSLKRLLEIKAKVDSMEAFASKSISEILSAKVTSIADIEKKAYETEANIKGMKEKSILEIKQECSSTTNVLVKTKDSALAEFKSASEETIKVIYQKRTEAVTEIEDRTQAAARLLSVTNDWSISDDDYQKLKNNLRCDLLAFNRENYSTIPLSPLFEENDTGLLGLYVQPEMYSFDIQKTVFRGPGSDVKRPVSGIKEVFFINNIRCQNIFLTSEAGQGKTVFCKRLSLAWCNAHDSKENEMIYFTDEDRQVMQEFDFVFLVSLRDARVTDCYIDDMIQSQIVQNLSQSFKYSREFVQTVLHREMCLVLLDGLDEWTHADENSSCHKTSNLPHRKTRERCTILTTTRSWKLGVCRLKSSQIDRHIEIGNLSDVASTQLIRNAVKRIYMNIKDNEDIDEHIDTIIAEIRSKSIPEIQINPLILTYLICLKCDGKPLARSKCEVYMQVIELLLLRAEEKNERLEIENTNFEELDDIVQPNCLKKSRCLKKYSRFLISLGKLAFQALFKQDRERMLVFERAVVDSVLTEKEFQFCLHAGLLIQSKLSGQLAFRSTRISFSHKSCQEFFAALYFQVQSNVATVTKEVLKRCTSVETVLEMSNVLIFLSGLDPEKACLLSKCLAGCIGNDESVSSYRRNITWFPSGIDRPIKSLQNLNIACVKESDENNHDPIKLRLDDIIIDQDINEEKYACMLRRLISLNRQNVKSVMLTLCASEEVTKDTIEKFYLREIRTLEKLELMTNISDADLDGLFTASVCTMKHVSIYGTVLKKSLFYNVCINLSEACISSLIDMSNLESLELENTTISHPQLERLALYLSQRTQMKRIMFYHVQCTEHGPLCDGISIDLSQHCLLDLVGFGQLPLSRVQINTSSLKKCWVGELKNSDVLSAYLDYIPTAPNLKHLAASELDTDLELFLDTVPRLEHLHFLGIYYTNMRNAGIRLSPSMENFERVFINHSKLECSSLERLVEEIQLFQQSVVVWLHDCTIVPTDDYEKLKSDIKLSERFVIKSDGEFETDFGVKYNEFIFETVSFKQMENVK